MPSPPAPPFWPVVDLPADAVVLDLRQPGGFAVPGASWTIGRYDEDRAIYTQALFQGAGEPRTVHMGVDLGGPAGSPVRAFAPGVVRFAGLNPAPGDYGPTLITEHRVAGARLWALHGHLSQSSLRLSPPGRLLAGGDLLGWLGCPIENGGWAPHLHFQLSTEEPQGPDLPGVVRRSEREAARRRFPDPRQVLGPIY